MTVGAISVVIATILGIIFGGLAGYFGGKARYLHHALSRKSVGGHAVHPVRHDSLRRYRHEAGHQRRMRMIPHPHGRSGRAELGSDLARLVRVRRFSAQREHGVRHRGEGNGHPRIHASYSVTFCPTLSSAMLIVSHDAGLCDLHADGVDAELTSASAFTLPDVRRGAICSTAQTTPPSSRTIWWQLAVPGGDLRLAMHLYLHQHRSAIRSP